ncbi:hypothetical protein [uncultured Rubinisphaera sp.]|uniref:hypothetical protein n=1 Tax=uncultured Rubinisphaera sp. TaxID=1678686 RepID=UPI0030DAD93D|tara:strand:+ start:1705 stop:1998 length:294 start_codon:yes stop_codon:yes gene_type:complete
MSWSYEMDLIELLMGEDMSFVEVSQVFCNKDHQAKKALSHYWKSEIIVFHENGENLADWKIQEILRDEHPITNYPEVLVSLTPKGDKAFNDGTWDQI